MLVSAEFSKEVTTAVLWLNAHGLNIRCVRLRPHADDGRTMRVRSLGRFTTVGEMGIVSGRPRSATIEADTDSTLYALPADQFDSIKAEHPELAQALLVYFMSVMAERLGFANRTIAALRR